MVRPFRPPILPNPHTITAIFPSISIEISVINKRENPILQQIQNQMSFQVPLVKPIPATVPNIRYTPQQLAYKPGYKGPGVHRPHPLLDRPKQQNSQPHQLNPQLNPQLTQQDLKPLVEQVRTEPIISKTLVSSVSGGMVGEAGVRGQGQMHGSPKASLNGISSINVEYKYAQSEIKSLGQSYEGRGATVVNPEAVGRGGEKLNKILEEGGKQMQGQQGGQKVQQQQQQQGKRNSAPVNQQVQQLQQLQQGQQGQQPQAQTRTQQQKPRQQPQSQIQGQAQGQPMTFRSEMLQNTDTNAPTIKPETAQPSSQSHPNQTPSTQNPKPSTATISATQPLSSPSQQTQTPPRKPIHDPTSEFSKFESYQSGRIRYQDPVVPPEQPREESPSQRQRNLSIKLSEAKRLTDQQERIATLTKTLEQIGRENSQLKLQVRKMREELRSGEEIRAESEEMRRRLSELSDQHCRQSILFEECQSDLKQSQKRNDDLVVQLQRLKSAFHCDGSQQGFLMALKGQVDQNQRIKDRFKQKQQQVEHLRQLNMKLRCQSDSYRSQVQLQKLKRLTQLKTLKSTSDIEIQRLTNEVDSLQKTVNSLDEKFKYLLKEDKKKDQFLVGYLKGKTSDPHDKELVEKFFRLFEQVPKLTMSGLVRQEREVQEQLQRENGELRRVLEGVRRQQQQQQLPQQQQHLPQQQRHPHPHPHPQQQLLTRS